MKDLLPSHRQPATPRAWVAALGLILAAAHWTPGSTLEIEITPTFSGEPVQPDSRRYQTAAGETFSFTRVSYLLSGFALQRPDGTWRELTNEVAWFDLEKRRSAVRLPAVPPDEYRAMRFYVGPDERQNHADVAQFPPDHALNPNLNNLHWSWQGGYIFLALEGRWRNAGGTLDGWAYHLARDTNRTAITLAAPLDLSRDGKIELDFDLATLFNAPRPLSFAKDGSSTHSRDGDPIAAALMANLPGAFVFRRAATTGATAAIVNAPQPLYLPATFTPYTFRMNATFPLPDLPKDNPLTEERVALGRQLFNDPALSKDGTLSCASCHRTEAAFADPRQYSVGVRGQAGTRNAMPLFNLAWKNSFFWDGRAPSLRAQALMPIQDHAEMDESLTNVVAKLRAAEKMKGGSGEKETLAAGVNSPLPHFAASPVRPGSSAAQESPDYPRQFTAAFGTAEITPEKIGLALEAFLLTLTSSDSKFDRALAGKAQLTDEEKRGLELFMTEYDPRREQYGADCFHCHGGPLFQSQTFANNGLDSAFADLGRAKVTGKDSDKGKFATPSLRNIALTAPYMHDGRFRTLEAVVEHYSTGQQRSATLDPNLAKHPDGGVRLSDEDKRALVVFLKTLTDETFLKP